MRDTINHALPGDEIIVPRGRGRYRRAFVEYIRPDGVGVLWFDPQGRGPHRAFLPHVGLCPVHYTPEAAGNHKSWWKKTDDEVIRDYDRVAAAIQAREHKE